MGYDINRYNTRKVLEFLVVSSVDHRTGVEGLVYPDSLLVELEKNGGVFAAPHGAVREIGYGRYCVDPDALDADTEGPLGLYAIGTGTDPTDETFDVQPSPAPSAQYAVVAGTNAGPSITLGDVVADLRVQLSDPNDTGWSVAEKIRFANRARRRTLAQTGCHRAAVTLALTAHQYSYSTEPIFRPASVRLGDAALAEVKPDAMAAILENWDGLPAGMPTQWAHLSGSSIRVSPKPDISSLGLVKEVASTPTVGGTGYVVGDVLLIGGSGSGAKVQVTTVALGVVTGIALHSVTNSLGKTVYYRGGGYVVATGTPTTAETGVGVGCTISVTELCSLEVEGAATASDIRVSIDNACTLNASLDTVASAGHGLLAGDPVVFSTSVGGLTPGIVYFVCGVIDANTFQIAPLPTAVAFDISANGSNVWNYAILEFPQAHALEVLRYAAEEEARRARPRVPGNVTYALEVLHPAWAAKCEEIKALP